MSKRARQSFPTPLTSLISLAGKSALITGSAAGIGEAIAYRFAEAGADLHLVDIDTEGLDTVRRHLSRFNVRTEIHNVDLSDKHQRDSLWKKLDRREPDILVNNAGIYPFRRFLDVDEQFFKKVMEVNLNSVFWMCQHMIKRRLRRGGVIINVSSIEAILPFTEDLAHYDVSKTGVIGLTRALAKEYGKRNFRVNAIIPGGIVTSGFKRTAKEILKLRLGHIRRGLEFSSRLPIGRFGQPDEVARMALVLASDMSSYVHGALIPIDGGFLSA
jgi:3-oxoacyl-[acyl-carrier protein] reductase